ncbi:NEBL protein, partial [Polyodon spathula]|nr:NEBL protein [Polyodon spathula]
MSETSETQFAKELSQIQSEKKYKEDGKREFSNCLYAQMSETSETQFAKQLSEMQSEKKYKEGGKQDFSNCLYSQMPQTLQTQFAKEASENQSERKYKEAGKREFSNCLYAQMSETTETQFAKELSQIQSEKKYKEDGQKQFSNCLYAQMPQTIDTVFAKTVSQNQSEKLYKQKYDAEKGKSDYYNMKEPPAVRHAIEVNKHQSNVSYKKDVEDVHKYSGTADRLDIRKATQTARLISNVAYKSQTKSGVYNRQSVLGRSDIEHAKEVSKLSSQVKYKEKFEKDLKEKKHQYNPQESASFKQAQAASVWASEVQYKTDLQELHDPTSDLPNSLYLGHALQASKLQSMFEYKKQYEKSKGRYHLALDTAERLHHKENVILQSQVKYKEDYKKSKGKSMLEFVDTQAYQVSKGAQKIQSEKEYRKEYEEGIKGKAAVDLEMTPGYLHARHATSLLNEVSAFLFLFTRVTVSKLTFQRV